MFHDSSASSARRRITISRAAAVLVAALSVTAPGSTVSAATADKAAEYEAKAAFIRNLVRFIDRPGGGAGPWNVCILGDDPFGPAIDQIAGPSGGVTLVVQRVSTAQKAASCQVVFVSRSEQDHLETVVRALRPSGALTIGDTAGFAARGVVLNFYTKEDKLSVEINLDAASQQGLNISSKVLSLARLARAR